MSKRKLLKAAKRQLNTLIDWLLVNDEAVMPMVLNDGYAVALRQHEAVLAFCAEVPFGQLALERHMRWHAIREARRAYRAAKRERIRVRRAQHPRFKPVIVDRVASRKLTRRQKQAATLARINREPYALVLTSAVYLDIEEHILRPLGRGQALKSRKLRSRQFTIHLGAYVGGELVADQECGARLVGGEYRDGVDVRVVCHWPRHATSPSDMRWQIKSVKPSYGSCLSWSDAGVRRIDHLPFALQVSLKRLLQPDQSHLVSSLPARYVRNGLRTRGIYAESRIQLVC